MRDPVLTHGAFSSFHQQLTYPLQLSQTVLRLEKDSSSSSKNKSIRSCLGTIYHRGGVTALFAGMRPKLLQTVLTAAFTFLTYEQIVEALHQSIQMVLTTSHQRKAVRH